ncbi:MAG: helix-turn-helix domain-containing protein [Oscillospiraceae bacterium]|nr:helix-turn-helix domain-containing protein [Oscillospiraceae bacterium]
MTFEEKLVIFIRRKGLAKTEVAALAGITYRSLANYIAGGRKPRKSILAKMAQILDTTPEFLTDEKRSLTLNSEERFAFNAESPECAVNAGLSLLDETKRLFKNGDLTPNDMQALFSCMSEVYFDAKNQKTTTSAP